MPDPTTPDDGNDERRARPFWSGTLTFGLVSIPVDLYPAVRAGGAPLRMLDADGTPLHRRYYCPEDGKDVSNDDLVRGFELDNGKYVTVTDEELEAVDPKKSREIDLRLFAKATSIDPIYHEHPYFLVPGGDSVKAYRLLASVMEGTKRAGIATFVMRDREYLVAIYADGGLLRAETLRFHDEVRSPKGLERSKPARPPAALVKKFEHAVQAAMTKRLPTAELTDDHTDAIRELAMKKKKRGDEVVRTKERPEPSEGADVIDLMEALKRSVGATRNGARGARPSRAHASKTRTHSRETKPRHARTAGETRRRRAR